MSDFRINGPSIGPSLGTPLLGQSGGASPARAPQDAAGARSVGESTTLSPELGESEGGANALLAAWGTGSAAATPPPLQVEGIKPGAQAGFNLTGGQVGGLEPGMQAGSVMTTPVLRA